MRHLILTIILVLAPSLAQASEIILKQPVRWMVSDKESRSGVTTKGIWNVMPDGKIQGIQGMTRFNGEITKNDGKKIILRRVDINDSKTCTYQGEISKRTAKGHYLCTDRKLYFWTASW
ncbi:MAG: hypothetical protein ACNI26_10300 [Terasakiella sp.]|uniref:hypothetical protein n=1 Tax=unclassified Terasakiella TaxID=2614952 RepID=UPI003B009820